MKSVDKVPAQALDQEAMEQMQSQTNPSDEYDTAKDEVEFEAAKAELEQSRSAIDQGFANYIAQNLTPELEELFFAEDKSAFFLAVEKEKEKFIENELAPKMDRVNEVGQKIADKKVGKDMHQAKQEFLKIHPNADFEAMKDFFENEVGAKKQKELLSMAPLDAFNEIYVMMGGEVSQELPKQIEGSYSQDDTSSRDGDLPANRF